MCMMCDGASLDEVRFHIHGLIHRFGWAVVPVTGSRPSRSWTYTIGLVERGHPEIVVVGRGPEASGRLLNSLGRMILEGHRFAPGGPAIRIGNRDYQFASVPSDFFEKRSTLALWVDYYGALGPPCPAPAALELLPQGQPAKIHLIH